MSDKTRIEWADATVNAVNGCSVLSPGCTNCYAMKLAGTRLKHHPSRAGLTTDSKAGPVWTGEVRLNETALLQPLRWKRPRRIFWNAHGDLFHEAVPDEWIDRVFAVCALTPQHQHLILTKRSARMREYFGERDTTQPANAITAAAFEMNCAVSGYRGQGGLAAWPLPNVWLGVSIEDQARADERIPDLLATPAAVYFISAEPLLSVLDLSMWLHDGTRESVSRADSLGLVQHGQGRGDLAARTMDGGRGALASLYSQDQGGAQFGSQGQLPAGHVSGWERAGQGLRAPHSVDDLQSKTDSADDGNQPHQRQQAGQSASEPRTCDAAAERPALPYDAFASKEGPVGREEHIIEADRRNGGGDSVSFSGESDDSARNGNILRGVAAHDLRHHASHDLEAPALIDWVIVGGESGPGARPMHPDWARSLRDQCAAAAVPFFFKQWGEWFPGELADDGAQMRAYPDNDHDPDAVNWTGRWKHTDDCGGMLRVGKAKAGRLLDGVEHSEFPA